MQDVREGYVTRAAARAVYGVVVAGGAVDADATATARAALRDARRARATFPARVPDPPRGAKPIGRLSASVEVVRVAGGLQARCAGCGAGLGSAPASWKRAAGVADTTVGTAEYAAITGAWAPPRAAEPIVLREYVCPGCGRLLETEVFPAGTPSEDDVRPAFWVSA